MSSLRLNIRIASVTRALVFVFSQRGNRAGKAGKLELVPAAHRRQSRRPLELVAYKKKTARVFSRTGGGPGPPRQHKVVPAGRVC